MCLKNLDNGAIYDYRVTAQSIAAVTDTINIAPHSTQRRAIGVSSTAVSGGSLSNGSNIWVGTLINNQFFPFAIKGNNSRMQWAYYSDIGPIIFNSLYVRGDNIGVVIGVIEILQITNGET